MYINSICSIIALVISGLWFVSAFVYGGSDTNTSNTIGEAKTIESASVKESKPAAQTEDESKLEESSEKDKYNVGDTWQNKSLLMTYSRCYEFTDFDDYNQLAQENKVICSM